MILPFTDGLVRTNHFDQECRALADRHYTRRKGSVGKKQFCYSGRKLVLRNTEGTLVFVWMWPQEDKRMDRQKGFNCAIFRNESSRQSSQAILEAEGLAVEKWGSNRAYTFIDAKKLRVSRRRGIEFCHWPPGRCYVEAGWKLAGMSAGGKHILEKDLRACPSRT